MKNLIFAILTLVLLNSCGTGRARKNSPVSSDPSQASDTMSFDTIESNAIPIVENELRLDSLVNTSDPEKDDSTRFIDTIAFHMDSPQAASTRDTIITSSGRNIKIRLSILGYSFFKSMRQNEIRNINAYVTIIDSSAKVIDTLKQINNELLPERKNDTASIITQNIPLFKSLKIDLIDPGSDFKIKQIHENSRQMVDSLSGNFWSWAIIPETKKSRSRVILRVVAEKPDGSQQALHTRNIPIDISLDHGFIRIIYMWLQDNPEKTLVLLLIPLTVFFWKRIMVLFERKPAT